MQEILQLRDPSPNAAFAPQERIALDRTDTMTRKIRITDALFERLRDHFDDRGLVDLVATVAAYNAGMFFPQALPWEINPALALASLAVGGGLYSITRSAQPSLA